MVCQVNVFKVFDILPIVYFIRLKACQNENIVDIILDYKNNLIFQLEKYLEML